MQRKGPTAVTTAPLTCTPRETTMPPRQIPGERVAARGSSMGPTARPTNGSLRSVEKSDRGVVNSS